MDGSCNEKAKVIEFKAAVKRNLKHRRKSRTIHQRQMNLDGTAMVSETESIFAGDHRLMLW
jgi:hypothetical protein